MSDFFDKKAVKVVSNVLSSVILIASILVCAVVIISAKSSTGVAKLGNKSFLSVKSDSMSPTFDPGDLIVITRYNAAHSYDVDDVISFVAYADSGAMFINTHRIVGKELNTKNVYVYTTKGDNSQETDKKKVASSKILGLYTGKKIVGAGKVFDLMQSAKGVLYFVVLPAALIVIWQLVCYLVPIASDNKKSRMAPANGTSYAPPHYYPPATENEKDAIIREYLARKEAEELKKQKIIEEYLAREKEKEEAEKAKAEEAKIKAIISEFLAQQKAAENAESTENTENGTESDQ
ncbi:MAG: signal peptidase I [Clostridia bacterium]|nr:signal peptidase I [Clostridia bacterium]